MDQSDTQKARYTDFEMLRRAQLAFALMLVLVLAPLGGVSCGIACLAAAPHRSMRTVTAHANCMHASACCHSNGPVICSENQMPQAIAALLTTDTATPHEATAFVLVAAESTLQRPRGIVAHRIDSSPPGQPFSASSTPLRI